MYDSKSGKFNYYRQSLLKQYTKCPRMVELQHVMGYVPEKRKVALVRGTTVHKSIQVVHQEKAWKHWKDVYDQSWKETLECPTDPIEAKKPFDIELGKDIEEELDYARSDGEEIFYGYTLQEHNRKAEILFSEVGFIAHTRNGKEIRGTIDNIRNDGKIKLVDFKTDLSVPPQIFLELDIQLKLYYYAINEGHLLVDGSLHKFDKEINEISWYQLRNNVPYKRATSKGGKTYQKGDTRGDPFIYVQKSKDQIPSISDDIEKIINGIENNIFFANAQSTGSCHGFCSFNNACLGKHQSKREDLAAMVMSDADSVLADLE